MILQQKMKLLTEQKRGLLATNFYNLETLQGVLKAASELNQPLILQLTSSSISYMGLTTAVNAARIGAQRVSRRRLVAFGSRGLS